ncbi:NADH-quinone oxidoreductase subunit J [Siphonobacter sp.]|uniref:NADH-quinone oxidoreductase subunit J family protein n=1 Tax=Siphonobacter sp. TaxID=1869184 RepID=UPI003B3B6515
MTAFVFLFFVVLTIASAAVVLISRNVLYSAFSLMVTFLGIAALYVFAGADFLAVTQIMVYVGGILVLLVFGVMLTRNKADRGTGQANVIRTEHSRTFWGILTAGGIFAILSTILAKARFDTVERNHYELIERKTTIQELGIGLLTDYALPFEVAGILLMVALLGAAYLSGKAKNFGTKE